MATTEAVPGWVDEYVGLPYAVGGRDRSGVDCFGLCLLVWRERYGLDVPLYGGVSWDEANSAEIGSFIGGEALAGWDRIEAGHERAGDAILMRMRGHPIHVGVIVADGIMLHCHDRADAAVEDFRTLQWSRRILGFYRYRTHA